MIFLVFLTAIILFNSFDFGYTSLATQEQCRTLYSCCDAGYGEGQHYYNLDESCFERGQCFDSCLGNAITGRGVFDNFRLFFSDFFSAFKGDAKGAQTGGFVDPRVNEDVDGNGRRVEIASFLNLYPPLYRLEAGGKLSLPQQNPNLQPVPGVLYEWYASPPDVCSVDGYGETQALVGKYAGDCTLRLSYMSPEQVYDPVAYQQGPGREEAEIIIGVYATPASAAKVAANCAEEKGLKLPTHSDYASLLGTGGYVNDYQIAQLRKIDANSDGVVNMGDFELFCQAYGGSDVRFNFYTDDGGVMINALDYNQLLYAWGKSVPGSGQQTFSCTGDVPGNAAFCSGSDQGLNTNTLRNVVENCVGSRCGYSCNSGYRKQGNTCVLNQAQTGGGGQGGGAGTQGATYEGSISSVNVMREGNALVVRWPDVFFQAAYAISHNPLSYILPGQPYRVDASVTGLKSGQNVYVNYTFDGVNKKILAALSAGNLYTAGISEPFAFGKGAEYKIQIFENNKVVFEFPGDYWVGVIVLKTADFDGDGCVEGKAPQGLDPGTAGIGDDAKLFAQHFGATAGGGANQYGKTFDAKYDLDNTNEINMDDFFAFATAYGEQEEDTVKRLCDDGAGGGAAVTSFTVREQDGFFSKLVRFFKEFLGGEARGVRLSEVTSGQAYSVYRKLGNGDYQLVADKRAAGELCQNGMCRYSDSVQQAGSYVYKVVAVINGQEVVSSARESQPVVYDVVGVELRHVPVASVAQGQEVRIIALAKNLAVVELKYKLASETAYGGVAFTAGQQDSQGFTIFQAVIPAGRVTGNIQYYVVGKDAAGSELKKSPENAPAGVYQIAVTTLPTTEGECNSGLDRDGDGVIAALDKDCTGVAGKGAIGIKSVSVDDGDLLTGMKVDVSCELNVVVGGLQDVVNGRCVQARIGNSYCENNSVVSGNGVLFSDCGTGFVSGKKEVVCFVDRNRCNADLLQGGNNTQKILNIELLEPDVCEDGVRGLQYAELRNIKLDKSSYGVGERVRVNVDVAAVGGKDLEDALVRAVLYDVEDEDKPATAEAESSESLTVKKGSRKSFTLYLQSGKEDYKHDHSVYLAVEVDEPEVCVYTSKEVRFKKGGPNVTLPPVTIGPGPSDKCVTGQTQPCGSDVGVCKKGIQRCIQGVWGGCSGEVKGTREVCGDILDNDCNGQVDCEDAACGGQLTCKGGGDASRDNDQDGLPDYWEQKYFGSLDLANGDEDSDGGGMSNLQEYVDGTDPMDSVDDLKGGSWGKVLLIFGIVVILAAVGYVVVKYRKKPEGKSVILKKPEGLSSESVQRMEQYIQISLKKGYSEQQIKTALAVKGWTKREIEDAFKRVS